MKACTRCGEVKPLNQFHRDKNMRDGRCSGCKPCEIARKAKYRTTPEAKAQRLAYNANRRATSPHVFWEFKYLERANAHGFEPVVESFTKDELIARWGDECFHCKGEWTELDHWPRAVSKGGHHTLESCRPSCVPCNRRSWGKDFTPPTQIQQYS